MLHTIEKRQVKPPAQTKDRSDTETGGPTGSTQSESACHLAVVLGISKAKERKRKATSTAQMTKRGVSSRWATLHRVSKARFVKRRAVLPLVAKEILVGKGMDDTRLDKVALEELVGGVLGHSKEVHVSQGLLVGD